MDCVQHNLGGDVGRMSAFLQVHRDVVRARVQGAPQSTLSGTLYRKATDWLGKAWASRKRNLLCPHTTPAYSEPSTG